METHPNLLDSKATNADWIISLLQSLINPVMKRRIIEYTITLWLILTLNFLLPRWLPGSPLAAFFDPASGAYVFDHAARTRLEAYYGLDKPVLTQYLIYLANLLKGDLGWSIYLNQPVVNLFAERLPWTFGLVSTAMLLAVCFSLFVGAEAAWRRGSWVDRSITYLSVVISNIPVFVMAVIMILVFAAHLSWFPLSGGRTPFVDFPNIWNAFIDIARHATLPVITLASGMIAGNFLLVRNTMTNILGEDFILVARARGLAARRIRYHHALRNSLMPFIAQFAAHASLAITGSVFVETAFNYPGMGRLIFDAVSHRDYPLIQGIFLVVTLIVLLANFLADLLCQSLDPRLDQVELVSNHRNNRGSQP